MLVLTRKKGEAIFIGEDIRITLLRIGGTHVALGIDCPEHLPIMRAELGVRTKANSWPNLTPDEMVYVQHRYATLEEWWTFDKGFEIKKEREDLNLCLSQLEAWALSEFIKRYSHWFKPKQL